MKSFPICICLLIYLFCGCTYSMVAIAKEQAIFHSNEGKKLKQIAPVYIFKDETRKMPLEEVLSRHFVKNESSIANLGITNAAIWVKFDFEPEEDMEQLWMLLDQPTLDEVTCYYNISHDKWIKMELGENRPFRLRYMSSESYTFPISPEGRYPTTIILRIVSTDQIQLPLFLGSTSQVLRYEIESHTIIGIYVGIALIMIIYNFCLYLSVKDENYLYYIAYIIFVALTQTNFRGLNFKYLWPDSPWMAVNSSFIIPFLSGLTTALFTKKFLMVKTHAPKLDIGINVYVALSACGMVLGLLGHKTIGVGLLQFSAFVGAFFALTIAWRIYKKGFRPAMFFLIAFSIFMLAIVIFVLRNFGWLPYNTFTAYILEIGSAIEISLISFALADRINTYRREKDRLQAEALAMSKENAMIISHQNILLETEVKERTAALENSNRELSTTLEDLKQAQTQLVESEKLVSLGMLTAGVAHEINNPINFVTSNVNPLRRDMAQLFGLIDGVTELIGNRKDANLEEMVAEMRRLKEDSDYDYIKEEMEYLLAGIKEGALRTTEIVKSLRIFARVDENDLKYASLQECLDATLVVLRSTFNEHIQVTKIYEDLSPIECYPGKLNQAFLNLITNAIHAINAKFEFTKGGRIDLRLLKDEYSAIVEIADNGTGIPPSVKDKIFEPFFTTKDVGEGTGLGLAIVSQVINKHHGRIELESMEGEGTLFRLYLPFHSEKQSVH